MTGEAGYFWAYYTLSSAFLFVLAPMGLGDHGKVIACRRKRLTQTSMSHTRAVLACLVGPTRQLIVFRLSVKLKPGVLG